MDEREFAARIVALLPGTEQKHIDPWCEYARELAVEDVMPLDEFLTSMYITIKVVAELHGAENAEKAFAIAAEAGCLNYWELLAAAEDLRDGATFAMVYKCANHGKYENGGVAQQEFDAAYKVFAAEREVATPEPTAEPKLS